MSIHLPPDFPDGAIHPALMKWYQRQRRTFEPLDEADNEIIVIDDAREHQLRDLAELAYGRLCRIEGLQAALRACIFIFILIACLLGFVVFTWACLSLFPGAGTNDSTTLSPLPPHSASSVRSERPGSSPPLIHGNGGLYRVTCYGPPTFPESAVTARGCTITEALTSIKAVDCRGICAVGRETPWYQRVRDEHPPILDIDGYGRYLAVDRIGHDSDIDIWVPWDLSQPGAVMWNENRNVEEVER